MAGHKNPSAGRAPKDGALFMLTSKHKIFSIKNNVNQIKKFKR